MVYNPHPSAYFPNSEIKSTGIFIPFTDLESYNINTTGDISQLAYSFLDAVATPFLAVSATGRPVNTTVSRSYQAVSDSTIKKIYTYSFNLSFSGVSVIEE